MAGHSKWAQIKRSKGAKDVKRGALFAKMAKMITIAAREGGGPDPDHNFKLRTAIEKAKAALVPNDNIKRAVEKASGGGDGEELKEIIYEGYLPGGVAAMVISATDNNNRTYSEVRSIFNKNDGSLGNSGCVAYIFEKRGEIHLEKPSDWNEEKEEELLMLAMEAGIDDIDSSSDPERIILLCKPDELESSSNKLKESLEKQDNNRYTVLESKESLNPTNIVKVEDKKQAENILNAIDQLEDHDDVVEVIANFDIDENLIREDN